MRTRLVTVALLAVCLATLALTASVADPSKFDEEKFEDDLPSNRTLEDYDENGDLITTTTRDDTTVVTETDVESDSKPDPDAEGEKVTTSETTKVKVSKARRIPDVGEDEDCGEPPAQDNIRIERGMKSRYSVGDVVFYSCDFGYVTDGFERTAKCYLSEITGTLQWRQPNIICNPRSCGDPGYVPNGQLIGSVFTFPNRITFECDEGFGLKGNPHRYCKTTGTWSGQLPTCEKITCYPPQSPINGKVSFNSLEFGSELRYVCNEGFLLRDRQTRICSANGTWSGDDPICEEAQCEPPVAPDFGTVQVVGGKSSVGSMALYTCGGDRFLVGSASSKCLDIGQWTFPTPKCLVACSVPKVPHGKIGRYVKNYRGRPTLKNMNEGDKIEDGSDLALTCDENYEAFGATNWEEKITCSRGEWSRYPRCEPATCRNPPPRTPNAKRFHTTSKHGSGVTYYCDTDFRKSETGNVKCHFGTWKGKTPTCKDTRCDVHNVTFAGVKEEVGKRFYMNMESYTPVCKKGYSAAKAGNKLMCLNEAWKGQIPPCVPANCLSNPPTIANGEVVNNFSRLHTSEVTYECDKSFLLKSSGSKVQCSFGEWTGTPPKCQDERCHTGELKNSGVSIDTASITENGGSLQVICVEGFASTGIQPRCVDGEWKESQPPCIENGCHVHNVNQGKITEKVTKKECKYLGLSCSYRQDFDEVGRNRLLSAGSTLYVTCDRGHTLHGKGQNNVLIQCSRGQWDPRPVCLRTGMPYREEAEAVPRAKGSVDDSSRQAVRPTDRPVAGQPLAAQNPQPPMGSIDQHPPNEPPEAIDSLREVSGRNTNCSCTYYNSDRSLAGYAGTERLGSGTGIKDGCKVRFHCSPLGYYRMMGVRELTCRDCRTWHSAEYPQCVYPKEGEPIIRIESNSGYAEMPGGTLGIPQGSALRLFCIPNSGNIHSNWKDFPQSDDVRIYNADIQENGYVFACQVLELFDIRPRQSGTYECAVGDKSYSLEVQVITPDVFCPIFSTEEDFIVQYDRGQVLNSSAVFSCKNPSHRLIGSTILTCMMNGQWSGDPPQCIKMCPKLPVTGSGLQVVYSNGQETDSTANFHCLLPSMRNGVPYTKCKKSGKWADPIPTCEMPSCPVNSLYDEIPENIVPDNMESVGETVAYNSSLQLKCVDDMTIIGGQAIAKCGAEGKWQVARVQCVSGCPPVEKTPDMLLDPEEEFYHVGQFVTFSCPPGQVLSSEVVRMMCLRRGIGPEWSEKDIPRCVNKPTESAEEEVAKRKSTKRRVEPADEDIHVSV